jgi:glycosyltransferase involved in cell wall biosynthesis
MGGSSSTMPKGAYSRSSYDYQGCYYDNTDNRVFNQSQIIGNNNNNGDICAKIAEDNNSRYFGLQNYEYCMWNNNSEGYLPYLKRYGEVNKPNVYCFLNGGSSQNQIYRVKYTKRDKEAAAAAAAEVIRKNIEAIKEGQRKIDAAALATRQQTVLDQVNNVLTIIKSKDELLNIYKRSDIVIIPSKWETVGIPILEALASEC